MIRRQILVVLSIPFKFTNRNYCLIPRGLSQSSLFPNGLLLPASAGYSTAEKPAMLLALSYNRKDEVHRVGQLHTVKTLESLFNINHFQAYKLAKKHKNLCKVTSFMLTSNYTMYLQHGIANATMLRYPQLLAETATEAKLIALKRLPYNINLIAVLVLLPMSKLSRILEDYACGEDNDKIKTFSKLLQIDIPTTCELLCNKSFLIIVPTEKLEAKVKLLKDFGISSEQICRDLWILRYSSEIIYSRLTMAKENKVEVMKTWMVRAKSDILETYMRRRSDNKQILGNHSLAEYLSERLDCSVEIAKYLITKQPVLENKSLKKLKEIIDMLFACGFKPYHICRVPKILAHSTQTTRDRLKLLESHGLTIDSLYTLTKSQKQFMQFFDALVKSSKKKSK